MKCPYCDSRMADRNYGGVGVDYCPACRGTLVSETQLRAIERRREMKVTGPDVPQMTRHEEKALRCPRCNLEMVKSPYESSHIFIDQCPSCKTVWFDEGELEAVQVVYRNLKASQSKQPQKASAGPNQKTPQLSPELRRLIERPKPGRLLGRWLLSVLIVAGPAAVPLYLLPGWRRWQFYAIYCGAWAILVVGSLVNEQERRKGKPRVRWYSGRPDAHNVGEEGKSLFERLWAVPDFVAATLRWTFSYLKGRPR